MIESDRVASILRISAEHGCDQSNKSLSRHVEAN